MCNLQHDVDFRSGIEVNFLFVQELKQRSILNKFCDNAEIFSAADYAHHENNVGVPESS